MKYLLAMALGLAWAPVAEADWAYTHWGMSPDRVVSASAGAVKLLPPDKRTKDDNDHWELAVPGTFNNESLSLLVGLTFDTKTGGLKCVLLDAFGDNIAKLRQQMIQR